MLMYLFFFSCSIEEAEEPKRHLISSPYLCVISRIYSVGSTAYVAVSERIAYSELFLSVDDIVPFFPDLVYAVILP